MKLPALINACRSYIKQKLTPPTKSSFCRHEWKYTIKFKRHCVKCGVWQDVVMRTEHRTYHKPIRGKIEIVCQIPNTLPSQQLAFDKKEKSEFVRDDDKWFFQNAQESLRNIVTWFREIRNTFSSLRN